MVQRHVQRISMYSIPSELPFADSESQLQTHEIPDNVHDGQLRALVEQMPAVMWTTDLELTVTYSAGNALARLNHAVHPFAGMSLSEFFHLQCDPAPLIAAHLKALGGYAQTFEYGADDSFFTGMVEPLFSADGNLVGTIGALVDITERKHADLDLARQQSQRLETDKRQFLADTAEHLSDRFGDLFNAICGYATIARMGLEPEHPMQSCLAEIEKAAQCATDLIDQLVCPPEVELGNLGPVNVGDLIRDQLRTFHASLPTTISLKADLTPDACLIAGDREQLRRLLVNLLFNSAAAIGDEEGMVSLRTRITRFPPTVLLEPEAGACLSEGEYVWLQVSDTGPGLDKQARLRIFEPLAGLAVPGIGLAKAKAIVAAHHGAITVSSKPGLGTTYHVLLPALAKNEALPPESFF